MALTQTNRAWVAGFFDGEGSIYITKTKGPYYSLIVKISQVDRTPLAKVQNMYGGSLSQAKTGIYYWSLCNQNAINFIKSINKYLVSKNLEATEALKFEKVTKQKGQYKLTPTQIKSRESIYKTLQKLKRIKYGQRH